MPSDQTGPTNEPNTDPPADTVSQLERLAALKDKNQVGLARERFFTPRLRFKTYEELSAWLLAQCVAYPKFHPG
jgi:hypothetical protein